MSERKAEVMFDAEHFFDGYKANRDFALKCVIAAYEAGARWVVLCDTNGGTLPARWNASSAKVAAVDSGPPPRHPLPQRHGKRGGQFLGRGQGRRASGAGHPERSGRALRQRQSGVADPDADAEDRLQTSGSRSRQAAQDLTHVSRLLDERLNRAAPSPTPPMSAIAPSPTRGLACLGGGEGPAHLRAHRPGRGRQPPARRGLGPGRALQHPGALPRDRSSTADVAEDKLARVDRDGEGARVRGLRLRRRRGQRSSCWRGARFGEVPDISSSCRRFRVMDDRRWNARGELVTESEATVTMEVGRRRPHGGGQRQRAGQRARHRDPQGAVADLSAARGHAPGRLQGAHPDAPGRHPRGHPGDDRKHRRCRPALEYGRGLAQHHRRLLQRAARRHHLEAHAGRGGGAGPRPPEPPGRTRH